MMTILHVPEIVSATVADAGEGRRNLVFKTRDDLAETLASSLSIDIGELRQAAGLSPHEPFGATWARLGDKEGITADPTLVAAVRRFSALLLANEATVGAALKT
jgi:hypothetical protein